MCSKVLEAWVELSLIDFEFQKFCYGKMAEWSKAIVLGTIPKGRGFESHSCQMHFFFAIF